MRRFLDRLRPATPEGVTVCETCAQACTPACRSAARRDQLRTDALRRTPPR